MPWTPATKAWVSAAVPLNAAGSGSPQWAVMGWLGHTGHTSPAAWSQTVKAKSSSGAPGPVNSDQDFDRMTDTSKRRFARMAIELQLCMRGVRTFATHSPTIAPTTCAPMKAGTSAGPIPEKLSVNDRAIVTAGLAKEVEAVNQ